MFSLKIKEKTQESHTHLFDSQLANLEKRGCPLSIVERFRRNREDVLANVSSLSIAEDHIPFLPVITPYYLGYYGLMALVRHNKDCGLVSCEIDRITDLENVSAGAYYLLDVEDGTQWQRRAPEIVHTLIQQEKRFSLTAAEAINTAIHTKALEHHALDAVGSSYASDRTPMVWLNVVVPDAAKGARHPFGVEELGVSLLESQLGKPALGWWYSSSPTRGGAPSCASRLQIK